jgi:uncharacterized membrane protein
MEEFILFVQFVVTVIVLWFVASIGRALSRVEKEQGAARKQLVRLKVLLEQLDNRIPAADKPVAEPVPVAPVSAEAGAAQTARTDSVTAAADVKIDLPSPPVNVIQPPPPPPPPKSQPVQKPTVRVPAKVSTPLPAPPPLSPIVANAREMLGRIWSWVLVGEEHRPRGMSMEYAVASTWLLRIGIVAIVACVAYFLKWSMDQNLMGPTARVALSMLVGAGMVVSGLRLLGKKYHLMGQGLLGGGILILYFSVYAAGPLYAIVSTPLAFGLMILVTTAAWLIAIRVNSMLVAILGIAGGFMTPVLLSTGSANLPVLYSYMLLLNLGILAVSHSRHWPLLNYLGFVLTYVIFLGSLDAYEQSDFPLAIGFVSAFFVIHSVIVYLYNIQRRCSSTALEIVHLVANACLYGGIAYWLIKDAHGRPYPAIMSLGMAIFYIVHVIVFLRRKLEDRGLLVALIALAGAYTALTLPLVFEKETLTIAFALLGMTFLWIGKRIGSRFMENLSQLLYLVVFVRLFGDMHRSFGGRTLVGGEYWRAMLDRLWTFGVSIGSFAVAFYVERRQSTQSGLVSATSDTPRLVPVNTGIQAFYWSTVAFLFLFLHLEINAMFGMWDAFRLPALTALWCGMGGYFLYKVCNSKTASTAMLVALAAFSFGSFLKVVGFDLTVWNFCESGYYNIAYTGQAALARLLDFGSILLLLGFAWAWIPSCYPKPTRAAFGYGGLGLLFLYTSLEVNSLLHWLLPKFQDGGVTSLWAIFAIAFTSSGIWRNIRPLRYMGLVLFAVVAGKVFLHDLGHMPMIFRVIAFFVVGIALLLGSFAYVFASKKFVIEETKGGDDSEI